MSGSGVELSEHPDGVVLPVKASPGARRNDFQNGWISFDEASGQVAVGP